MLKILYASTAPFLASGYGIVTKHVTSLLKAHGYDVIVYAPQVVGAPVTWNGLLLLPSLTPNPYDCDVIYHWYKLYDRNLLITHWDVWVLHGLIGRDVNWMPYVPIDAPLDEHTYEINVVLTAPNVVAIIAQSKFGYNEIRKVTDRRVYYIPHGVDTQLFRPLDKRAARRELRVPEDVFVFGFVGRNESDRKDIVGLLKAFKIFRESYPDARDVYLILWTSIRPDVGRSYDVVRLVKRYRIDDRVLLPERQPPEIHYPHEHLVKVYNCMDWLVTASSGEGFNLPVLEALACGVPVLAPRNSTHVELIEDRSEHPYPRGLTVKPKYVRPTMWTPTHQEYSFVDPHDLAEAMHLAYSIGMPDRLREWCREFARRYDWKNVIKMWFEVLEEVEASIRGRLS